MKKKDTAPKQDQITRNPFPNSKKIYVKGKIYPQIKVAMREISLSDTTDSMTKKKTSNEPVTVYDTSGPYTDPSKEIDIHTICSFDKSKSTLTFTFPEGVSLLEDFTMKWS